VHREQQRRHEHEGELDRLRDAGDERGEGGGDQEAGGRLALGRAGLWIIARRAAGRANIMIGKKPAMKMPTFGPRSAALKKQVRSPLRAWPAALVQSSAWNQTNELRTWCRPIGMSARFAAPKMPAPIGPLSYIQPAKSLSASPIAPSCCAGSRRCSSASPRTRSPPLTWRRIREELQDPARRRVHRQRRPRPAADRTEPFPARHPPRPRRRRPTPVPAHNCGQRLHYD
jgi:hypothetical protein